MNKQFYLFCFIFLLCQGVKGQSMDAFFSNEEAGSFRKIYLHTDREFYFLGDTLWFSAYMVEAKSHIIALDTCNLFVELFNSRGELMQKEMLLLVNGYCSGCLDLGQAILAGGDYLIRAYTDELVQLGQDYSFIRNITISEVKNQSGESKLTASNKKRIRLVFYPEGGFLLEGKINQMVFKAYDEENNPIDVQGKLILSSKAQIIPFKSEYKGMGRIFFIPDSKEKYKIEIQEHKLLGTKLPEIKREGAKVMLSRMNDTGLTLNILSNLETTDYYIAFLYRGEGNYYVTISAKDIDKSIRFANKNLKPGINRIVLLNSNFQPISERLIFYSDPASIVPIDVNTQKQSYKTRDKIELKLDGRKQFLKDEIARISVSVVKNEFATSKRQSIQSCLLLDSELKGMVHDSHDYFQDSDDINSAKKLDLLMLTKGWSNYIWNERMGMEQIPGEDLSKGFNFHGHVTRLLSKKPMVGSDVLLSISNENGALLDVVQTNESGQFSFESLQFSDTTMVIVQANNYRNKSNTSLHFNYAGKDIPGIETDGLPGQRNTSLVPVSAYREKYINEKKLDEFYPDRNSRILEEIEVVAKKEEVDDGHFRMYSTPDHSVKVEDIDVSQDVFMFLTGRFPGVHVVGDNITIRGVSSLMGSSEPLFLLDGMPVDKEMVRSMSMFNVDKVEVIKGTGAAIFGMRGGNGVISILTKRGGEYIPDPKEMPGIFIRRIKGFQIYREFYSPDYTADNLHKEIPDYRTTLYWNPYVILNKKAADVSFFSCDNLSRYKVIVEGISSDGRICIGEGIFDVDERQ